MIDRSWARRLYERLVKRAIGTPDVVISPSKFLKELYEERGFFKDTNVTVLPNPSPKKTAVKREPERSGPTKFLFVGQLERHKGIELLLDAVQKLEEPFQLHIAGDGALAQYVAEFASRDRRMHFHGFISFEHISRIMSRTDAVIVPSLCYENSPTVIYEAFQVGVPVIASDIGGIPELIKEGENGWLVPPDNKEALVQAMQHVSENKETLWKRSSKIRDDAEQYALRRYVDKLEALLDQKS